MNSNFLVMLVLFVLNIILIVVGLAYLRGVADVSLFSIILVILGGGLAGLFMVVMFTSRLKNVAKAVFSAIFLAACSFGVYYLFQSQSNTIERHYVVTITDISSVDVKFTEYWLPSDGELKRLIAQMPWYMGDQGYKDRREMLNYYFTEKAEEKETGKNLIIRENLGAAQSRLPGEIVAYVSEYRSGPMAVEANPQYILTKEGRRINREEEEAPPDAQ
jgi:hypothetical protein